MRVLVTGGAGFIGSHLASTLLSLGHDVTVVDNFSSGKESNLALLPKHRIRYADCRDFLGKWFNAGNTDFVFHLAATVGVNRVLENPKECIENNLDSLRSTLRLGVPGLYTSTSEVYGKNENPLAEDTELIFNQKSRWSYATSKLVGEWLALQEGWKVVRLFNVVGPKQSQHYGAVMPTFIKQAVEGKEITVYGDGTQVRSFINVKDCVRILIALMEKDFGVVNIGGYETLSIGQLANNVRSLLGAPGISYTSYKLAYGENFDECKVRVPDLTKLHSLVGFQNNISLEDTIKEIAALYTKPALVSK